MNPCGDLMNLQNATIIVAVIEMVGAIIGLLSSGAVVLGVLLFGEQVQTFAFKFVPHYEGFNDTDIGRVIHDPPGMVFGILTFLFIICLLDLYLAAILLMGARQRRILKCSLWFRMKTLLLVISLMFIIVSSVTFRGRVLILIFGSVTLTFQLYCLFVVKGFIEEIRMGKYHRRASSVYSQCEEEFMGEELQKL